MDKMDNQDELQDPLIPLNRSTQKKTTSTAVAISSPKAEGALPTITASGRGSLADRILQLAFDNDVKVREDKDLADMLARIDIDSPVPTQALLAVAEILSYVYRANGEDNPLNAVLDDISAPMILDEQNE